MILRDRQNRIVSTLRADGAASVRELAEALSVSESTIRRDLEILDRNGELTRTYGGAVRKPGVAVGKHVMRDAGLTSRVADAAAEMVTGGTVVILDLGPTTPLVARRLHGHDITVVTPNLAVFDELRDDEAVRLVLLGGVVRRGSRGLVGSLAELALGQVNADLVFLSCTGVRANGQVVDDLAVEAPSKQSMIAASDRVVLLAPETNFPGTGALRLCSLADIDVLVTTPGAPGATLALCRNAGGEVVAV
ncbi:DeoR/GlpR family DNA-binding transcription regulator [Amycolatopsis alkalitolerans]|uniref:DeoR/GlpR transcriptional regulator n=1 Tax=Amycolatopsis alkalitolerans TaxID=2547244 RepID=A0A5C4M802_9PSEU|nr:DeoR/GlpR family DNA-binding transcription regulator [Amycolatopsis alkalitolerans]TNC29115.1 DeoR/GlpR transcriptional regulator [Amycolatopsis alkalitolerans]